MKRKLMMFLTLFILGIGWVSAQVRVQGTVVDEAGEPIIGATVVVKGTSQGTVTDVDGSFTLTAPADGTLVISYVGYATQEVPVSPTVRVVLSEEVEMLEEVIVTAMGIRRSEKTLGYAAASVSGDEITEARTSDIMSGLSGKIAGVQISSTAPDPGSSNSIIIRGISSLGMSNQPLFIVDGAPIDNSSVYSDDWLNNAYDYGNGANLVNPDDVASMTILKGAAATALYGSRAANGVVLITTKSGTSAKGMGIEYNGGLQGANILRLPEFQNEFGMGWDGTHTLIENGSWGPKFDGSMQLWGNIYNNSQKMKPYLPLENNVRDFFETGFRYSNSLSIGGANDKYDYFVSFSQLSDDGLIPSDVDTYDRYTFSLRGSYQIKGLNVSASVNYADQTNRFAPTGQGLTIINSLYQIPRDVSIVGMKDLSDPFNSLDYFFTPYGITNPYWLIENVENKFNQRKLFGKFQADYNILENLVATYRLGFDSSNNQYKIGNPRITGTPGTPNEGQIDQDGNVEVTAIRRQELNHDFLLNFNTTFTDFTLNALGGVNVNERTYSNVTSSITGLDIPTFYNLSNSASAPVVEERNEIRRLVGVFGNIELGYKEFLFANISARNDWSSTLPKGNNSFFYPGVTLSFIFTELLPRDIRNIFSFGKLRLAYGKTGNDAPVYVINPYYVKASASTTFSSNSFPLGGLNAYTLSNRLGNNNLSPEITTEYEIGANVAFYNGRINIDFAYYDRKSDGQIFPLNMDPATGYTSQYMNLGQIGNKGVELLVGLTPIDINGFKWKLNWNYTKNNNKVISLPEELGGETSLSGLSSNYLVAEVGKPIGFKTYRAKTTKDGQIIVNSKTGLPQPTDKMEYIGKMDYDYEMGLLNNFSYKGLSVGFDFDFRKGGLMFSRTKDINYFVGNAIQTIYNERNPFIIPNSVIEVRDNKDNVSYVENTVPISVADQGEYWANGATDMDAGFLIDKSFIKLRSANITYNIPNKWLRKINFLTGVQFSFYGNNLFVWTPKSNTFIDPEVSTNGNDLEGKFGEFSANPSTRKFGFNLKLKF